MEPAGHSRHQLQRSGGQPAHLDIEVSHCTPLLWNPNLCFHRVTFAGSFFLPHALLVRHHVVLLQPKIKRRIVKEMAHELAELFCGSRSLRGGSTTSIVAVYAILCGRVGPMQPPTATVCSGETSYRLRSPRVPLLPSLFFVAPASSALCPSRCVENDSTNFACPRHDHKSQAPQQRKTKNVFCRNVWMTNPSLTHHEKAVRTRCHKMFLTLQGWTDQETTYKQDVCKKSGSSPHKSQQVVYRGSEHAQRQHALRTTPLVMGGPMPQHATKTVDRSHIATVSHGCARGLLKPCSTNSTHSIDVVST